jgi:threonine dehydrogenase-like Zn-dependent dehydrogenase
MKAITNPDVGVVEVNELADPTLLEPTDALLRVTRAAICGSDLHMISREGRKRDPSHAMGHEFLGVVEEVGPAVRGLNVGERYVAAMYTVCGRCAACIRGEHSSCAHMILMGTGSDTGAFNTPNVPGGQAELVRVPRAELTLWPIPDDVSDEDAIAISDILSTVFTVFEEIGLARGETVAIVGAGPVGQLAVMAAPLFGASRVFCVDLVPDRLRRAEELGAEPVAADDDPAAAIRAATRGAGVDVAVDAVGADAAFLTAFEALATGGRLAFVNVGASFPITPGAMFARRATVKAVLGNPFRWRDPLMRLIQSGRIAPSRIVSHRMPLAEGKQAYEEFRNRRANKVLLAP